MNKIYPALAAFAVVFIASCSSISEKDTTRNWNPAQDSNLVSPTAAPIQRNTLPYPAGKKMFVENTVDVYSGVPCAGSSFLLHELEVLNLGVSNRDVAGSAALLSTMGYPVFHAADGAGQRFDCDLLIERYSP